jgi:hypothetical protein
MKKTVLLALLLATFAAAAHAVTPPILGRTYACEYDHAYPGPAANPGLSTWTLRTAGSPTLIFTYETFTLPSGSTDTYKATWAWKADLSYGASKWEFTFNPSGPQCKSTIVYAGGGTITFDECTDGHSRYCYIP